MAQPELILNPETQLVTVDDPSPTISVQWDRAVQQAVINTKVGPTIASRAYGIVHTAIFDAWAAYDPIAIATQLGNQLQRPEVENTDANKSEAMSFAAYRVLSELFPSEVAIFDELMAQLGFDPSNTSNDITTPAGIGNVSAEALMEFRRQDGSNQLGDDPNSNGIPYSDTTGYQSVNTSDQIVDIERWTAERVPIDSPDAQIQNFLTPQWGQVTPFALESGEQFRPEAPQPFLLLDGEVDLQARTIALAFEFEVDISPEIVGEVINPEFIKQAEDVIEASTNLTYEQKLVAEFWEDGGGTSFPPGTWMTFGQFASARDDHSLDTDAKLFFSLGNAVFDAGVATWESKVFYDYVRPVRAIRSLGELGLIGEFNEEHGGYAIEAWAGPGQGTQTILATDFTTYQTPGSDPSPPFSEYTSGHSAFSASGATILELLTGSDQFGASVSFEPGESRFEPGFTPEEQVTLAWDTFSAAADEAGISRIYGGIHFEEGDINGRTLGEEVGLEVFKQAQFFIQGGESSDFLFGTGEAEELVGTQLDETIYARAGDDTVAGALGDDLIFGGDGEDVLRGDINQRKSGGTVGGDDTIHGGQGNDRIGGKAGNDYLFGDEGDDKIWGDDGDDLLRGGLGDDTLTGDNFSGGSGSDIFVLAIGEGTDTIIDFEIGEDLIGLAGGLSFGQLSVTQDKNNTLIGVNDETLAILNGVETALLVDDAESFILV
ncbi:MAG: calcium-binding protein [Symploca sp. SIO1C4]|uniref:Calcium-binding protein n=1 Tax=Symploca sp. SIO1C4 TaxID=2607765 RepID=A0A6B3NHT2_9CYAN|nr:calcium-binding protein [Symploca sp. SIO1C4]